MLNNTVKNSRVSQEERNLKLINAAIDAAKQAVYACSSEAAKTHLEYVLAYLNESWIAESGQDSNAPKKIFEEVQYVQQLEAAFSNLHQR